MKIEISLEKWYAKGNVETEKYAARLENTKGQRCCLGFCALAHGATWIKETSLPEDIAEQFPAPNWMLTESEVSFYTSALAKLAIDLNDALYQESDNWLDQPLAIRMGNLITIFAEGGDDLVFVP